MKRVKKAWGSELWVVNCDEYCSKLLYLDKGAQCSYHQHIEKKETFLCLQGVVDLNLMAEHYFMKPLTKPITIEPKQWHSFRGVKKSVILEISTHHDDRDVIRLSSSRAGVTQNAI